MLHLLPWNPINLVDGESHWIFWEITYLIIALVISKFLGVALGHIGKKINKPSFTLFSESIYKPLITLIWYLTALYSIDLVTDELLSQGKPRVWTVLINGGIVIALGWFLLRLKNNCISYTIQTRTQEGRIADAHSMQAISKLFTVAIGIIILILLNDFTGMNLTTLLAFGGVGGLALAFASQEIVSNFFGGFMIHMTRPFLIGEELSLPSLNVSGIVEEIGWYQTRIRPQSKESVYVPNSLFSKALLLNKTRITHRLFNETIYIKIAPISNIEMVIKDINEYLSASSQFEKTDGTGARIESIGDSAAIVVYGLTRITVLSEFYRVRGETLIHISNIVAARGGAVTSPPNTFPSA
jgi:MscS family membrane protein